MTKYELLASTAPVKRASAATDKKKAERKASATRQGSPRPAPQQKPEQRHHGRDGDHDDDGGDGAPDVLVPDPDVCRELSITSMTAWRWDRDPAMAELGWPPRVSIRNRNHRFRRQLERFKANLLRRAIATRAQTAAAAAK